MKILHNDNEFIGKTLTRSLSRHVSGETFDNALVVGMNGTGRVSNFISPNVTLGNNVYVVFDVHDTIKELTELALIAQGYTSISLDFYDIENSEFYDPFTYVKDENEAARLIDTLIAPALDVEMEFEKDFVKFLAQTVFVCAYRHGLSFGEALIFLRRLGSGQGNIDETPYRKEVCEKLTIFASQETQKHVKDVAYFLYHFLDPTGGLLFLTRKDTLQLDSIGKSEKEVYYINLPSSADMTCFVNMFLSQLFSVNQTFEKHVTFVADNPPCFRGKSLLTTIPFLSSLKEKNASIVLGIQSVLLLDRKECNITDVFPYIVLYQTSGNEQAFWEELVGPLDKPTWEHCYVLAYGEVYLDKKNEYDY